MNQDKDKRIHRRDSQEKNIDILLSGLAVTLVI
jgi:hypothetical protein